MAIPELYRYGREGTYFGFRLFSIYIFDGIVQVNFSMYAIFVINYNSRFPVRDYLFPRHLCLLQCLDAKRWIRRVYI